MISPTNILGTTRTLFSYHLAAPIVGKYPVMCVGHMFDSIGSPTVRFPFTGALTAQVAYYRVLSDMHDHLSISAIITGGTHGADSFAVWWALMNDVPLLVVRPYSDPDHVKARIPEGYPDVMRYYEQMERLFKRALDESRALALLPRIPAELMTEDFLTTEQLAYLHAHDRIPNQVIAQAIGEKVMADRYSCYAWTNAEMLSLLSASNRPRMVALWNGKGGRNPGGTEHAVRYAMQSLVMSPSILTDGLNPADITIPIDLGHLVVASATGQFLGRKYETTFWFS